MSRVWTQDELATLRSDLSEIAATVAVESAFWRPSRAARQASQAGRPRLAVRPHLIAAGRAFASDRRRIAFFVLWPALLFGLFAADRPLGAPNFAGLQVLLGFAILAAAMAFGWEDVIRSRLGLGGGPMNAVRLMRLLKVGGFIVTVMLSLGFSVFFATALLPSIGLPHAGILDMLMAAGALGVAGPLLFHAASLAAEDGRAPSETQQLLAGNGVRFAIGSMAALTPFLMGLGMIPALAATPIYAIGAVVAAGLMLAGGLIYALFLADVYREASSS